MQMPVECRMELSHQRKELSGSSDNFLQAFLIARGLAHEQPTHEVAMALNAILCNAKATDAARWPLVPEAASRMSLFPEKRPPRHLSEQLMIGSPTVFAVQDRYPAFRISFSGVSGVR
jgi:hypothetical protein